MRRAAQLFAIATTGCVVASGRHPSRLEVAREPNGSGYAGGATGQCKAEGREPEQRPPRPAADSVWFDGQCRWDGVRYLWEPGHWAKLR
jgi:hypothetical protein